MRACYENLIKRTTIPAHERFDARTCVWLEVDDVHVVHLGLAHTPLKAHLKQLLRFHCCFDCAYILNEAC